MKRKGCQFFTGWPDEGLSYCDREVGEDGTHDGLHSYPHVPAVQTEGEDEIMEDILKKIIESFEANLKITEQLISDLKSTLKDVGTREGDKPAKRRAKDKTEPAAPPVVEQPKTDTAPAAIAPTNGGEPKPHSEGGALQVKDVTIEMIRERSTVYSDSKNFGMDAWLALAQKVTGQKKVKDIPKEMYGAFYAAMNDDLDKRAKEQKEPLSTAKPSLPPLAAVPDAPKPAAPVNGSAITIEHLKEKAKVFMDANGQPALVALVKAFGATKISEIAPAKYPAFLEAISNA
jgi:hypothetical protein